MSTNVRLLIAVIIAFISTACVAGPTPAIREEARAPDTSPDAAQAPSRSFKLTCDFEIDPGPEARGMCAEFVAAWNVPSSGLQILEPTHTFNLSSPDQVAPNTTCNLFEILRGAKLPSESRDGPIAREEMEQAPSWFPSGPIDQYDLREQGLVALHARRYVPGKYFEGPTIGAEVLDTSPKRENSRLIVLNRENCRGAFGTKLPDEGAAALHTPAVLVVRNRERVYFLTSSWGWTKHTWGYFLSEYLESGRGRDNARVTIVEPGK